MRVRVEFYGRLKRAAGSETREVELGQGAATVADLLDRLRSRELAGAEGLQSVVAAVGDEVAEPDRRLRDGDVVGLLPPVSGG